MFGVIERLLDLAREALAARGDAQLIGELEQEVAALRKEVNALKDYRDAREVDDEARRILER